MPVKSVRIMATFAGFLSIRLVALLLQARPRPSSLCRIRRCRPCLSVILFRISPALFKSGKHIARTQIGFDIGLVAAWLLIRTANTSLIFSCQVFSWHDTLKVSDRGIWESGAEVGNLCIFDLCFGAFKFGWWT